MTTTTDNDLNERKARLAYADEANWFELPGRAGVFDPAFGFQWAPYNVIVYGTPDKEPSWGWAIRPYRDCPERDIRTNWSFTFAEAKQDAWRALARLIRGERTSGLAADDGRPH